jgi:hypothetical protein
MPTRIRLMDGSVRTVNGPTVEALHGALHTPSDQVTAIVGCAAMELALDGLLRAFIVSEARDRAWRSFFGNEGEIGRKTCGAWMLGLISHCEYQDLLKIAKLRNLAAHPRDDGRYAFSFHHEAPAKLCADLRLPRSSVRIARERLIYSVYYLAASIPARQNDPANARRVGAREREALTETVQRAFENRLVQYDKEQRNTGKPQ